MDLKHVALVCRSEENSDRFYHSVLGLPKLSSKTLPAELSRALFDVEADIPILNYGNDEVGFEIFIFDKDPGKTVKIEHTCLAVGDRQAFLEKCRSSGVEILQVPKGEGFVVFVRDYDGNIFEIK